MRTRAFENLFRTTLLRLVPLAAPAIALVSGCAVTTSPDGANESSAQEISAQPQYGAPTTCGGRKLPAPRVCETWTCDGDAWAPVPYAAGQACMMTTGATGACSGIINGPCLATNTGTITPKFYVLSVEYAPPGAASTVDYGMGTSWGSTLSTTSSWENSLSVTVSNHGDFLGFASGGLSVSASKAQTGSTKDTTEIKDTMQDDFTNAGDSDLVDHGLDRIYLWLTPQMDVTIFGQNVTWALGQPPTTMQNGESPLIYVTPDWLLGVSPMPPQVGLALADAGITPADYAGILAVDPFATNASPTLDPLRYVYQTEIPYEPVTVPTQKPTPTKHVLTSTTTSSTNTQAKVEYKVGVTVKGSLGFIGVTEAGLTVSDSLTLTSTNEKTLTNGTTLSASATIMQPEYGYTGPIYLNVYLDTIYNTFMFVLTSPPPPPRFPIGPGPVKGISGK